MTLWFVGTGVSGYASMPGSGLEAIRGADVVYVERFTSPIAGSDMSAVEGLAKNGRVVAAKRWMVEDGREILENAAKKEVVLLSYGNPYVATTHVELRTRAANQGVRTRTVHGASAVTAAIGECGLHHYKIGRMATVMDDPAAVTTPYYVLYGNMVEKSHTVLLLEYDQEGGGGGDKKTFMSPATALGLLLDAEEGQGRGVVGPDTFAIVASRIGLEDQGMVSGRIASLAKTGLGAGPHTVIIPGAMHFTEADAVRALTRCLDEPQDNRVDKISGQMISKYVPMVREALGEVAPRCAGSRELEAVLENAELYIRDAETFLEEGRDEVAVLAIGYADGLVDALRMAKGMDPKM